MLISTRVGKDHSAYFDGQYPHLLKLFLTHYTFCRGRAHDPVDVIWERCFQECVHVALGLGGRWKREKISISWSVPVNHCKRFALIVFQEAMLQEVIVDIILWALAHFLVILHKHFKMNIQYIFLSMSINVTSSIPLRGRESSLFVPVLIHIESKNKIKSILLFPYFF